VSAGGLPRFVICEDGHEYSERFGRLLGARFAFVRAGDCAAARAACTGAGVIAGLLLDLDFRRTPGGDLVDEAGAAREGRPEGERRRLSAQQGILILRALRGAGVGLAALLFADLDDEAQVQFLEESLAPLQVVPSSAGLAAIAEALEKMAGGGLDR
jgi:hypothetical protein